MKVQVCDATEAKQGYLSWLQKTNANLSNEGYLFSNNHQNRFLGFIV